MILANIEDSKLVTIRDVEDDVERKENEKVCNVRINTENGEMTIELPDGIKDISIGEQHILFLEDYDIKSVKIKVPDSVQNISRFFSTCNFRKLETYKMSVEFGEESGLEKISGHAFNTTSVAKITLPPSIKEIEDGAFFNCYHLTDVTIKNPNYIDYIGENAFGDCENLARFNLPGGIITLDEVPQEDENHTDEDQMIKNAARNYMNLCLDKQKYDPSDLEDLYMTIARIEIEKMGKRCNAIRDCNYPIANNLITALVKNAIERDQTDNKTVNLICGMNTGKNKRMEGAFDVIDNLFGFIWINTTMPEELKEEHVKVLMIGQMVNILHELKHMRQWLEAETGISSYSNMRRAKDSISIYRHRDLYDKYHDSYYTEIDADKYGIEFLNELYTAKMSYFAYSLTKVLTDNGKDILFEDYVDQLVDSVMASEDRPDISVSPFKILSKEYNNDGTKKSPEELIEQMNSELGEYYELGDALSDEEIEILVGDCKAMYFEILYREMQKSEVQAKVNNLGELYDKENSHRLFSEMMTYFSTRIDEMKKEKISVLGGHLEGSMNPRYEDAEKLLKEKVNFLRSFVPELVVEDIVSEGKDTVRLSNKRLSEIARQLDTNKDVSK